MSRIGGSLRSSKLFGRKRAEDEDCIRGGRAGGYGMVKSRRVPRQVYEGGLYRPCLWRTAAEVMLSPGAEPP